MKKLTNMKMKLDDNTINIRSLYCFTQVIHSLLNENEGVVIDVEVDWMKESFNDNRIVVFCKNNRVGILLGEKQFDHLKNGDKVLLKTDKSHSINE